MGLLSAAGTVVSTGASVLKSVFKLGGSAIGTVKKVATSKIGFLGIGAGTAIAISKMTSKTGNAAGIETGTPSAQASASGEKKSGFGAFIATMREGVENTIGKAFTGIKNLVTGTKKSAEIAISGDSGKNDLDKAVSNNTEYQAESGGNTQSGGQQAQGQQQEQAQEQAEAGNDSPELS